MRAGRKPGYTWDERARQKIKATEIVNRLRRCALGQIEMAPTAVKAAEILLKKALPDLSAVEYSGFENRGKLDYSIDELVAIARSGMGDREAAGTAEPDSVH